MLEDAVIDCVEAMVAQGSVAAATPEVDRVRLMILLAQKVQADGTLARQLRRKVLAAS